MVGSVWDVLDAGCFVDMPKKSWLQRVKALGKDLYLEVISIWLLKL